MVASASLGGEHCVMEEPRRPTQHRVFVNRSLNLGKIKYYGFDMDYTLAEYISPEFEKLGFKLVVNQLVKTGYPAEFQDFSFDHTFGVRGMWFDCEYGNLLKVDAYGNVMVGVHGFHFLSEKEIEELYPNKFVSLTTPRIYVLNTLFNIPETYLLACVINFFDKKYEKMVEKPSQRVKGVRYGDAVITYKNIFQDVRKAVDFVHIEGDMKTLTMASMDKYVRKDERLPLMLNRLRQSGAKLFLLTNSGFEYTKAIMSYLLNDGEQSWTGFFDYIVVDAAKPAWFAEGTALRQVDTTTGALRIGSHSGPLRPGAVYSGGSCDSFCKLVGVRSGKDVLYVGDHIFGDVLRSKKTRGWRTFLIIPELQWELKVWTEHNDIWEQMHELELKLQLAYRDLDSSHGQTKPPHVHEYAQRLGELKHKLDQCYCVTGSLFRSGSRLTFFASQVERYADLYAGSAVNLLYYPFSYFFRAPPMLMPHESTVDRLSTSVPTDGIKPPVVPRGRLSSFKELEVEKNNEKVGVGNGVANLTPEKTEGSKRDERARTPRQSTFVHEEEDLVTGASAVSLIRTDDTDSDEATPPRDPSTLIAGDDVLVVPEPFNDPAI